MAELKPCPFCGGKAEYRPAGGLLDAYAYVLCEYLCCEQHWYSKEKKQSKNGTGGQTMASEKRFTEWLDSRESYGVFSPPIDAQTAVDFLQRYLLGEDWYTVQTNTEQINTEIVHEILYKYSKKYRKEWKRWLKRG